MKSRRYKWIMISISLCYPLGGARTEGIRNQEIETYRML